MLMHRRAVIELEFAVSQEAGAHTENSGEDH